MLLPDRDEVDGVLVDGTADVQGRTELFDVGCAFFRDLGHDILLRVRCPLRVPARRCGASSVGRRQGLGGRKRRDDEVGDQRGLLVGGEETAAGNRHDADPWIGLQGASLLVGDPTGAGLTVDDPRRHRRCLHRYLQYLDRHGSVAARLCAAAVPAWVVHGETGDGGITDEERRTLQAYPWIRIVTIPGRSFFTPNEEPALVADLVVAALAAAKALPAAD